jgi:hypothetical protein
MNGMVFVALGGLPSSILAMRRSGRDESPRSLRQSLIPAWNQSVMGNSLRRRGKNRLPGVCEAAIFVPDLFTRSGIKLRYDRRPQTGLRGGSWAQFWRMTAQRIQM